MYVVLPCAPAIPSMDVATQPLPGTIAVSSVAYWPVVTVVPASVTPGAALRLAEAFASTCVPVWLASGSGAPLPPLLPQPTAARQHAPTAPIVATPRRRREFTIRVLPQKAPLWREL